MEKLSCINYYEKRTFSCKQCNQRVTTVAGMLDRRTKFCSSLCSRRYWRHANKYRQTK